MPHSLSRVGYRMRDGVDQDLATVLFRTGLRVLRPVLRTVVISPVSDDPWPGHMREQADQLIAMARTQQSTGIVDLVGGRVTLDARAPAQFALAMVTCCYTTSVRGYGDFRTCLLDGGDTGTRLWLALTSTEHATLRARSPTLGACLERDTPVDGLCNT